MFSVEYLTTFLPNVSCRKCLLSYLNYCLWYHTYITISQRTLWAWSYSRSHNVYNSALCFEFHGDILKKFQTYFLTHFRTAVLLVTIKKDVERHTCMINCIILLLAVLLALLYIFLCSIVHADFWVI